MAPVAASLPKRKPRENQYLFDLGVRGRKTGLTLPDTGIRDENGLEPMDHLFSSPEKAPKTRSTRKMNGANMNENATISSEEDMDEGESTIPEPTAVLTERKQRGSIRLPPPRSSPTTLEPTAVLTERKQRGSIRLPPPRSKSPMKTHLQSPARRNPSLGPVSSPIRGSIVEPRVASTSASVRRKLDFSNSSMDVGDDSVLVTASPQRREESANPRLGSKLTNGTQLAPIKEPFTGDATEDDQDTTDQVHVDAGVESTELSLVIDGGSDDRDVQAQDDEAEEIPEEKPQLAKRGKGRPKAVQANPELVVKGRIGRRKKANQPVENEQEPKEIPDQEQRPPKRTRRSLEDSKLTQTKPKKAVEAPDPSKPKAAGQKLDTILAADSPQIQRGPPMPRSRGLFILRRETPMEGTGFKQTRSGRNSIKPLAYWKNERVEYSEDENEDHFGKFVMPRIKEVVRADEVTEQKRSKYRSKPSKSKKRKADSESEDKEEAEPWEAEPGRIYGDVRFWDPEDQMGLQAAEHEEEIALSSAAIITRDIKGATFRFAKTLTHPFFGSGMVDLPPGAMKKPKNSRKMQMVFFVFSGRVQVTVNESVFRIGKGGMWQVPRGNFYSIENDYEKPARIFFSQGCEIQEDNTDDSQRMG